MPIAPQLSFKNMEPSIIVESVVAKNLRKLKKHHKSLASCRVVFERRQNRRTQGDHYRVSLDIKLNGGPEVAVTRDPPLDKDRDSAHVALREAFEIADRRLSEAVRKRHLNNHERKALSHEAELDTLSREAAALAAEPDTDLT